MDPWKIYDSILEEWLPTKWTKWIAGLTSSIAIGGIFLPNFLQKIDIHPTPEQTLLIRLSVPPTICFVGTFIVLLLVVRHCKSLKSTQSQPKETGEEIQLDEPKVNILKLLFERNELTMEDIARVLSFQHQTAKYHLEELKSAKMVDNNWSRNIDQSKFHEFWKIMQPGRKYLHANGIIT